jgi:sulfopyruvate decarboxylase TPP-binding subunit
VASGLIIGGRKPVVMMQNQGLHNCLNTLRTCGLDARLPLFMVIGQFGREFDNVGQDSRLSRRRMVNLLLPVLDAMQISSWTIDCDAEIDRVAQAWNHSKSQQAPAALVLGHYTAWD